MQYYNYSLPDLTEHRQLKKYYRRLSWIIITLVFIFSFFSTAIIESAAAIIGGGFNKDAIESGKEFILNDPILRSLYSYGFPIAADIAALGIGIMITKIKWQPKFSLKNVSGKTFMCFTALSFGISTIGAFLNVIILSIITVISGAFTETTLNEAADNMMLTNASNPLWIDLLTYFYICLLGPVLEELIFRGVLLDGLRKYGNWFGIIISSILFGLMHQNFMQCIPAICMGIVWGYMTVKTGSIIPSIIIHILNNSLSSLLLILMENVDITAMIEDIQLTQYVPLIIALGINMIFRLVCIIASAIIIITFFKDKRRLYDTNDYTRVRTWKYFFTSIPWLIVIIYMTITTVTSISI